MQTDFAAQETSTQATTPAVTGPSPAQLASPGCDLDTRHAPAAIIEAQRRLQALRTWSNLRAESVDTQSAAASVGIPHVTLWRWHNRLQSAGLTPQDPRTDLLLRTLAPGRGTGRPSSIELTPEESHALRSLYLRTNATADGGSQRTAAKFFAADPGTREELRHAILTSLKHGHLPTAIQRAFQGVTATHFVAKRRPKHLATEQLSGTRGAFADDKIQRRRVIEADDGTVNFVACIPWPLGGDPCSDKFGWRVGRWQLLPAIDAGWSHAILGYSLIARPRGSYRADDIRSLIHTIVTQHGLPDVFRFERGSWESDAIVDLVRGLGVDLQTVYQSNQKPYIEGFFNKLWTYLSVLPGQVGRYRGEMERENLNLQRAKAGRVNPTSLFPKLTDIIPAIDGAIAFHNSDTIDSIYGKWIPEVRHRELNAVRPWTPMPSALAYLFAPITRDWTVQKGTVGGRVTIVDDCPVPFYFANDQLYKWNGRRIRVHFDPAADPCVATLTSLDTHHGYAAGDVIGTADLIGDLPHFARAARGWSQQTKAPENDWRKKASSQVRRTTRALAPDGQLLADTTHIRDARGSSITLETGPRHTEQSDRLDQPDLSDPSDRSDQPDRHHRATNTPRAQRRDSEPSEHTEIFTPRHRSLETETPEPIEYL